MQSSLLNEANSELFDGRIISPFQKTVLLPADCIVAAPTSSQLCRVARRNFFSLCQNCYYPENYLYSLKNALLSQTRRPHAHSLRLIKVPLVTVGTKLRKVSLRVLASLFDKFTTVQNVSK